MKREQNVKRMKHEYLQKRKENFKRTVYEKYVFDDVNKVNKNPSVQYTGIKKYVLMKDKYPFRLLCT